jgi:hypothetical protein
MKTGLNVSDARYETLFASSMQPSHAPITETVLPPARPRATRRAAR